MNKDERKKEIIEQLIKNYIDEERMENAKIKIIMSNPEYMKWIAEFTKDKEGFSDEDLYHYKDSEKENIEKLGLFYKGVDIYAKTNHIYPKLNEFGSFYKVKYNKSGYQIGCFEGQGRSVYYLTKLSLDKNKGFIEFNDILNNKRQDNVDSINKSLYIISNSIIEAHKNGVPIEAINETVRNTIDFVSSKDNSKKLLKK